MRKPTYTLPPSLVRNPAFAAFCRRMEVQYLRGFQYCLRHGSARPSESYVVGMMSQIFGDVFVKVRPNWLKDDFTDARLELDGYSARLRMAVEFQCGRHHTFCENTLYRDNLKIAICEKEGITLFVLWPTIHSRRLLLDVLVLMGEHGLIPNRPVLWFGCWLNRISSRAVFSHSWLTCEEHRYHRRRKVLR